jgi:hypothetical protein
VTRYTVSIHKLCEFLLELLESDRDAVIIVDGDTGIGKTVFSWQLVKAHAKLSGVPFVPADHVLYERGDFNEQVDHALEMTGLLADEAVGIFYSRDYHDDQQIALLKKLDRIRYRHLVVILVIPRIFHIDKHIRDSRVRYWIHVDQRTGKGKTGEAHCYIFEKERNPFNTDPWNLSMNRKLFMKGKIDKSPNYLGEIIFKDIPTKEYNLYRQLKDIKREMAEIKEWDTALMKSRRYGGTTGEKLDKRITS